MHGVSDSAGSSARSRWSRASVSLSDSSTPSASRVNFYEAQYPACTDPCPTLQVRPHNRPRMARGQSGSLRLLCTTLSFAASCRFIPALSELKLALLLDWEVGEAAPFLEGAVVHSGVVAEVPRGEIHDGRLLP